MEWDKAKNIVLIFFILLNIGLGVLLFFEHNRYTIGGEQERIIRAVLGQNNISMYTSPVRRFPPMRPLNVSGFYYDIDQIKEIFFADPASVIKVEDYHRYHFTGEDSRLIISNGFIFFDTHRQYGLNDSGRNISSISVQIAQDITRQFVNDKLDDFILDSVFQEEGEVRVVFRQMYRGQVVHSNFVEFFVTEYGIRQVEMQFGTILGHGGTSFMIFSPDEVLLTFAQRADVFFHGEPQVIIHMDLAYLPEYMISDQYGTIYPAVPFYRIFVIGFERPFLINARTNDILF
ncbi:MAG: hypothetical protein FWC78_01710 [Defluviitaleaceae bacterium]|nr:hypothetical protein [Defluviitaleaceae bacterium]